jgi:two-component system nitrogen regulation sensor histidine kinase GlnL
VLPCTNADSRAELLMELHQVDRQIRITREEHLISQHQATQALLRGLAHEIKNPLGGLRGAAQLLERELPSPDLREYTRIIIDEADRLQALLNRMLGPNQLPQLRDVNIHHVLEHVRGLLRGRVPAGPTDRPRLRPEHPGSSGRPDRLIQALLNIARNGAQAAGMRRPADLAHPRAAPVHARQHLHRLVLRVEIEDTGPGIPDRS